jgi:hypothetical protein
VSDHRWDRADYCEHCALARSAAVEARLACEAPAPVELRARRAWAASQQAPLARLVDGVMGLRRAGR